MDRRFALVGMALIAGMASVPAEAQTLPDKYRESGKIIIGTTPNYPPVTFRDPQSDQLTGYDIDIGNAIGAKLGLKVEWQEISFEQMVSAASTGRIDLILGGMNDLPARRESLDFVDYMKTSIQYFVQHSRTAEFKQATDLCGKSIGASRRTDFPHQIELWSGEHCVKAGLAPIKIVGTEGSADARAQLRQGRIDAGAQGSESLPYLMKLDPETYSLIGEPFATVFQGIGLSKNNPALRGAVAAAFAATIADGTYQKIVEKYGVPRNAVTEVTVNGEPLH